MTGINRRSFLRSLARIGGSMAGLGLLGGCGPPPAAPLARVYRVGLLTSAGPGRQTDEPARPFFWQRLGELGYVEGQNLAAEIREASEDNALYDDVAAELVRLQVDVIVAGTGPGIRAAVAATSSIPIVMMNASTDPVAEGFADSVARPGRNVTGTLGAPREVEQKRLQLLVEAAPGISKVALLAAGPQVPDDFWESAARSLRVDVLTMRVASPDGIEAALGRAAAEGAEALLVQSGSVTNPNADLIISFAERHRLPAVYPSRPWVTRGGLMVYEARGREIQRRTADYVDRILRGARPGDLPIEYPTRYDLVLNLKAARALGLTFGPTFLAQVDEVIE